MSEKITTYESFDDRIAPEAITEDLGKGLDMVDGHAVKAPGDYENPDKLYDMLIARIRKYHPSTDVSMIRKAYDLAGRLTAISSASPGNLILYILYGCPLYLRILRWIKRQSLLRCFTMSWRTLRLVRRRSAVILEKRWRCL